MKFLLFSSLGATLLSSSLAAQQDETYDPATAAWRPTPPVSTMSPMPLSDDPTWSADAPSGMQVLPGGGRAFSECDHFTGPNGPMLGPWTQQVGTQNISSNAGIGVDGQGNAWMLHDTGNADYDASVVEFDLIAAPSGALNYVAAVTGVGTDMLYTKVQSNSGGLFDRVGFYVGFNGGGFGGYGGFFTITPVTGGHVTIYVSDAGDTMNIDIDEDQNGTVDYHYESSGILGTGLSFGTGTGIGTYDDGHYDRWELNYGCRNVDCDDFNRPAGLMTGFWIQQAGQQDLYNMQGKGQSGAGNAWMSRLFGFADYTRASIEFDLPPADGNLQYVAAVTGYDAVGGDMLYTKIQAQGGSLYNYIGFYQGFNGGGLGAYGGFTSITPFEQGHVRMYTSDLGDTMNVDFDVDYDHVVDFHYESSGILGTGLALGGGLGIGTYGEGTYDNWSLNGGCPRALTLTIQNLVAGQTATVMTRGAEPGAGVGFAWSATGAGPTTVINPTCGPVTVSLSNPINILPFVTADAQGQALFTTPVSAGASGVTIWVQSLDTGSCQLTNGVTGVIG